MRTLGNILWFVLGGVIMGLGWWLAGAIAFISIIGIPWARSCFVIGRFSFFPFGQEAIVCEELIQRSALGRGTLCCLGTRFCLAVFGWCFMGGHMLYIYATTVMMTTIKVLAGL